MLGHHWHAIETPFKWCFAGGPIMACFWWYLDPLAPKKTKQKMLELEPLRQNFLDPRMNQSDEIEDL